MTKTQRQGEFNGVKVFSATMIAQRQVLDEVINTWLEEARAKRPGFEIIDIVITQSSDEAYHCIAISVFYYETAPIVPKARRG